jgi:hypothetical protein
MIKTITKNCKECQVLVKNILRRNGLSSIMGFVAEFIYTET